jgi:hypothetical protein
MTVVRRSAMGIAAFVVRYAAPGCRDWAEGLAREAEFIEDDWSALGWAIGSTRVLLDRREATVSSLSEAASKARHFLESLRRQNYSYLFFCQALTYALRLLDANNRQQRAGCVLVVLAGTYMGIFDLLRTRMVQLPPNDEDAEAWAFYYRRELERRCGPGAFVGVVFSSAVYIVGVLLAEREGAGAHPILGMSLAVILLCGTSFFVWKRRQYQHQIEALEVILRETR